MQSFLKSIVLFLLVCSTVFFYACSSKSGADEKKEKQGAQFVQPEKKYLDSEYKFLEIQVNDENFKLQSGAKSAIFVEPDISEQSVVVINLFDNPSEKQEPLHVDEPIKVAIDDSIIIKDTVEYPIADDLFSSEAALEKERLEREEAEKARLAEEAAERERIAKEEAEKARLAKEAAERERIAKEEAEKARLAEEAAERERIAKEEAEKARLAEEAAERERIAKEEAEKARLAEEAAERERIAKEEAEKARLAEEAAEKERIEKERIEKEAAEKERIAKKLEEEKAQLAKIMEEKARIEKELAAEKERIARDQEEKERLEKAKLAQEEAEKARLAKEAEQKEKEKKAAAEKSTRSNVPAFISETPKLKDGENTKLLRYPDIHRYTVVFVYGGDLWTVESKGGVATRLTAHPGQELFPKFSPDGKWIAFTGQYDGDEQVYVMPAEGGAPKQLTFYPAQGPFPPRRGYDNIVYGWTPDGKSVLFRSLRDSNSVTELGALYTVNMDGGLPNRLPMPTAGAGDFSPDGKQIVYSPLFRDFRSWKRYEGGWAQDLAIFDLNSKSLKKIAVTPRTERDPMWIGEDIYFVSDRSGTLNLYKYGTKNGAVKSVTNSKTWDVRWASSDNRSKIVYELGGELKMYNTDTNDFRDIPVRVPHDGLAMRASRYDVAKDIGSFALSPGGKRVVLNARGDIFTVPAEKGAPRNLTQTSGAHDRDAVWSHDGSTIAWISDKTGEDQIYLIDQKGDTPAVQLSDSFSTRLTSLSWSPNGKYVGVITADRRLFIVPTEDFTITDGDDATMQEYEKGTAYEVAYSVYGGSPYYSVSPCGQHIALTLSEETGFTCLYLWSLKTRQMQQVTQANDDVFSPCWDPDGKYLYYLARHEYAPMISSLEWNYAGTRNTGIYALALRKDVPNPFAPQSDEVEPLGSAGFQPASEGKTPESADPKPVQAGETPAVPGDAGKTSAAQNAGKMPADPETKIDFDGLAQRVVRVPVGFENYGHLRANKQFLFYLRTGARFNGRDSYETSSVRVFDLKERKETQLTNEITGTFNLSPDGSKILFSVGNSSLRIGNADAKQQTLVKVPTSNLAVDRIPVEEWEEVFNETCRKFRDHFYVKNMHGYDWKAICDQYRALLPHVAHRSDLNYVISEMISELNVGHAYVQGGDFVVPKRMRVGLPGARFELDTAENRYKIGKIFAGQNEEPKYRAPLREIGVDMKVGDYVLEIDGKELLGNDNPYRLLQDKTQPVTLSVNDKPTLEGARKVVYQPIFNESNLLYLDFVTDCRERVDRATDGKVGYLHIPDMGPSGIAEFIKWYYPQVRKEGLVIDVRSNGGGNVSQWIIMRLNQKLLGTRYGSLREGPATYPYTVFHGHLACLINETSASDGDIFPYYFRKSGLGPLIGKKSWGGVVGISSRGALIDGGEVMVPLIATNDENGEYIIEGTGVEPDIEVENEPKMVLEGHDPQLERGIEEVMKKIELEPKSLPQKRPEDPIKTKNVIKKYNGAAKW